VIHKLKRRAASLKSRAVGLLRPRARLRHGDVVEVAGARVTLRADSRARRVSLRISGAGEVIATAPNERRLKEAHDFALSRSDWILERLAKRPSPWPFAPGGMIHLRGEALRLEPATGAGAARVAATPVGRVIRSGGEGEAFSRRIESLLRREARRDLEARVEVHCRALDLPIPKIGLGDPKSRWGSCTPGRASMRFSWRLVMAPPAVLDYVAAHEVAHLVHPNHSPAFWGLVRELVGDERASRQWLKANGTALHAAGRG
jgi:predicted metal-dependent hydrolase